MMKTFSNIIQSIPEEHWNYYHNTNTTICKPKSFADSRSFTDTYFANAEKSKIFGLDSLFSNHPWHKIEHSVSIYFLGCYFAWQLEILSHPKLILPQEKKFSEHFLFIWFLACLFHDTYSYTEQNSPIKNYKDFISPANGHKITNLLTRRKSSLTSSALQKSIRSYYTFRQKHWHVNDHGISAGLILFDNLIKIRKDSEGKGSQLDFSKPVETLYKEAAWAIATHNIYFPTENDNNLYQSYGLSYLIGHPPILFKESPFLYLLGLVDTIDPVKTYHCCNSDFVAEHIQLQIEKHDFGYSIQIKVKEPLDFSLLSNKKAGIERWLKIEYEPDTNSRTIHINIPL